MKAVKAPGPTPSSVMIEKFASTCSPVRSEFLDLNHTSNSMILVSLMIPKFAPQPGLEELRNRDTRRRRSPAP